MNKTATTAKTTTVLYKDMTPAELRDAYWFQRRTIARYGDMATMGGFGRQSRAKMSANVFRAWDRLDLIANVARKRGIDLLATD